MSNSLLLPAPSGSLHSEDAGFSLVEALVAALLLVVGATAALALFTSANQLFKNSQTTNADQSSINADLDEIQKRNRRFVCTSGSCDLLPSTSADPNEDQYTPVHPGIYPPGQAFDDKMTLFKSRCTQPVASPSSLLIEFKTKALDTLPETLTDEKVIDEKKIPVTGITRSINITTPAAETPPTSHAYVVTYAKRNPDGSTGTILRRVRLVPTVAGWCP